LFDFGGFSDGKVEIFRGKFQEGNTERREKDLFFREKHFNAFFFPENYP
jgi:hypothetical protein